MSAFKRRIIMSVGVLAVAWIFTWSFVASGWALDVAEPYEGYFQKEYPFHSYEQLLKIPTAREGNVFRICVEGYIDYNRGANDTKNLMSLYWTNPVGAAVTLETMYKQIAFDILYSKELKKFEGQKCRLYGVYFVPSDGVRADKIFGFIRIDRVVPVAEGKKAAVQK
jgi:hypothetical protein